MTGRCFECGRTRALLEMVEASDRRRPGIRWLVCGPAHTYGDCFRVTVGPVSEHRIENALEAHLARAERSA